MSTRLFFTSLVVLVLSVSVLIVHVFRFAPGKEEDET